jgi:hypothetical protein
MLKALKDFYKWSPVVANLLLAGLILLLFTGVDALGGPSVDMTWLMGALGIGTAAANFKSVTSPRTLESVRGNEDPNPIA